MKNIIIGEERNQLTFLLDWNKTQNATSSWHFGTEYSFNKQAMLRLGVNNGQVAFGAGASYNRFHLDYNFGKLFAGEFAGNHRFSVTIDFGKSKSEEIRIARERREQQFRVRADREAWFKGEQEFTTRFQKGKDKYPSRKSEKSVTLCLYACLDDSRILNIFLDEDCLVPDTGFLDIPYLL